MIIDALGMLRADGNSPRITGTEDGSTSLTRDATTGQVVVGVYKTPQRGIPIVVLTDDDTGTSSDKTLVTTIEAADELAFDATNEVVATFPAVTHGDKGTLMVRRVHTQKKYLRSVVTLAGEDGTISVDLLVVIGHALMNED